MHNYNHIEPIDYLVIGHLTQDITPNGFRLGGTASYSALTAKALGLRVGVVTTCAADLEFPEMDGITVVAHPSEFSTTFQNIQTPTGRKQYIHHIANVLNISHVPETWRNTPIVHLGPIAREIDPNLARYFPNSLLGITPQGMLRGWNSAGQVHFTEWPEETYVLEKVSAAIISVEDVQGDEDRIDEMASTVKVLVVTEASNGARLYWNGDLRRFNAPAMPEVDPTGAGDIFAATFFFRLYKTNDPWEATRYATCLAAKSVARVGLAGVPTPEETRECISEII
jgi:hypothetical protein